MTTKDIAWLSGILEGEGWFSYQRESNPFLGIKTTDKDIIDRVKSIINWPATIQTIHNKNAEYKTSYQYVVNGKVAIQWMMTLYCLMGKRR